MDRGTLWTKHSVSSTPNSQTARKATLDRVCENLYGDPRNITATDLRDVNMFSRIYVDEKYKLLYCEVPKVACTNWKRILLILSGHMNTSNPEEIPAYLVHSTYQNEYLTRLSEFSPDEVAFRIENYFKFLFVREPMERILSAYLNKFTMPYSTEYQRRFGRKIVRRYRRTPSRESLKHGHDVTFNEFAKFLLDSRTTRPFDAHWRPYQDLCHPCLLRYDVIGKYETLDEDVHSILRHIGVEHLIHFPDKPKKILKTSDRLKEAYSNITASARRQLWHLYETDADMFGYQFPLVLDFLK